MNFNVIHDDANLKILKYFFMYTMNMQTIILGLLSVFRQIKID